MPRLLRYQGIAVDYYGFTLDALSERSEDPVAGKAGASSTFAQLRYYLTNRCCVIAEFIFLKKCIDEQVTIKNIIDWYLNLGRILLLPNLFLGRDIHDGKSVIHLKKLYGIE